MGGYVNTVTAFDFYRADASQDTTDAFSYYNQPEKKPQGNRRQRRALAAQKRRKSK